MATCPICRAPLACVHAADAQHTQAVDAAQQDCPLQKGAIWVQVLDDKGAGVKGVTAKVAGKTAVTDDAGFAPFDPLDEKAYDVEIVDPIPATHKDDFLLPDATKVQATVEAGEIVLVKFRLAKLNKLTPVIELEYEVALLNRGLDQHQEPAEPKKFLPDATRIEVSLQQTNKEQYPFAGTAKLACVPANVEVFTDATCKTKLAGDLTAEQITAAQPLSLYLRGKAKGKVELSLEIAAPADKHIKAPETAPKVELHVAELVLLAYEHDVSAIKGLTVNPDEEPLSTYHTNLHAKAFPALKKLSDQDKVKVGRLLHEQKDGNHGRAKVVIQKLEAADWPAATDDYKVYVNTVATSGAVELFDVETGGSPLGSPAGPFKIADLKAAAKELWVEGKTAGTALLCARVLLTLDRAAGGLAADVKNDADWARFSVVKLSEVKLDYTPPPQGANAWDEAGNRFFVNLKTGDDGRKIVIGAQLSAKLADVVIHFMLVEHRDNRTAANWGVDLPTGAPSTPWVWKDIGAAVKHLDKGNRAEILHVSEKTNADGYAKKEVMLSRFGGDKFYLAAYIEQDPHLAKYIDGHTDLGTRKPVMRADAIQVWRKFWYKEIKIEGVDVAGFLNAADVYADVKVVMEAAGQPIVVPRAEANTITPRVIYPKNQVSFYRLPSNAYANNYANDASDALVIGDDNEGLFWPKAPDEPDKPVMIRMMNANGLWIDGGQTAATGIAWQVSTAFPIPLNIGQKALDPPIAGGDLLVQGSWFAEDKILTPQPDGSTVASWGNPRNQPLAPGDVDLDPARSDPNVIRVKLPAAIVVAPTGTRVKITGLVVQGSDRFLGTSYDKGIVNAYTPNDTVDFVNTINHEIGHSFKQTCAAPPAGVPAHGLLFQQNGAHCNYPNKACLMWSQGPVAASLNRYCPVCHPYVLVQDMSNP